MDTTKYGSGFIKPADVREAPRVEKITHVFEDLKFDRLNLLFESGNEFGLNQTNTRALQKAYGVESDNWLDQVVQLKLGHYRDRTTDEDKETITLTTVSVRTPSDGGNAARAARTDDTDIPF